MKENLTFKYVELSPEEVAILFPRVVIEKHEADLSLFYLDENGTLHVVLKIIASECNGWMWVGSTWVVA